MEKTNNCEPLVSVYIPTHNRANLLKKAVLSIFSQSYRNIEILICDDGSTDNTGSTVDDLRKSSPFPIIYIKNKSPMGACNARNRCISVASGEYITGLDDDDQFTEDRISTFIHEACVNSRNIISANHTFSDGKTLKNGPSYSGEITFDDMKFRNHIGNQIFTKTKYLREIGGFDENLPAWQDYDAWFRLLKKHGNSFRVSASTYVVNVDHGENRISTSSKAYKGHLMFLEKHAVELSKDHVKSLRLMDLINRRQKIPLSFIFKNISKRNIITMIKLSLSRTISSLHLLKKQFSKNMRRN